VLDQVLQFHPTGVMRFCMRRGAKRSKLVHGDELAIRTGAIGVQPAKSDRCERRGAAILRSVPKTQAGGNSFASGNSPQNGSCNLSVWGIGSREGFITIP
jgi:hypothetical protein